MPMEPVEEEAAIVCAAPEPAGGSKIWTPDSDRPAGKKSSLWTPS
jgi:hypothetical protein